MKLEASVPCRVVHVRYESGNLAEQAAVRKVHMDESIRHWTPRIGAGLWQAVVDERDFDRFRDQLVAAGCTVELGVEL